jgi:hypothetical protein
MSESKLGEIRGKLRYIAQRLIEKDEVEAAVAILNSEIAVEAAQDLIEGDGIDLGDLCRS